MTSMILFLSNMNLKECRKCGENKPQSDFYAQKNMADGLDSKCKECAKSAVRENRKNKIEYYRSFDSKRANQPHRVLARKKYSETPNGRAASTRAKKQWKVRNKKKALAVSKMWNAINSGRLVKVDTCEQCGADDCRIHGHHDDYEFPLSVRWLCSRCHREWHKNNGEARNPT